MNQQANGDHWNFIERNVFNGEARFEIVAESDSCSTSADTLEFVQVS